MMSWLSLSSTLRSLLAVAAIGFLALTASHDANAQSIVVMVNDDPITSYDVAQRQRFLALTSGLGNQMRARMKSDKTKQAFRDYMRENRPQSREEAKALQKKFVQKLQRQVVASTSRAKRKTAIDQLVEERLMIQAAKERKIVIDNAAVNRALTNMAKRGGKDRTLKQFLSTFKAQGINPTTLKEKLRAQLAWGQLIRSLYGPLVRSTVSSTGSTGGNNSGGTTVDVQIVKLSADGGGQKALAQRLVEAEKIRSSFSSCSKLSGQLRGRKNVSVQQVKNAKLKDFPGDMQAAISKASKGVMTPPQMKGEVIETVAVCNKTVAASTKKKKPRGGDERQQKMQLYAQRHLKDLKARAHLKYPSKG